MISVFCSSLAVSSCEKQRPAPLKLAIQKYGSSVEECLARYGAHPVVMFVTSRWGSQGIITEKLLEDPKVAEACMRYNAVVVVADMSTRHEEGYALCMRHGQQGLPHFAIYPADRSRPPYIGHSFYTADGIAADINAALR